MLIHRSNLFNSHYSIELVETSKFPNWCNNNTVAAKVVLMQSMKGWESHQNTGCDLSYTKLTLLLKHVDQHQLRGCKQHYYKLYRKDFLFAL